MIEAGEDNEEDGAKTTVERDKKDEISDEEADSAAEEEFDFDLSDLKGAASEESDVEDCKIPEKNDKLQKAKVNSKCERKQCAGKDETCRETESSKMDTEKFKQELIERKKRMEEARKELPYTFQGKYLILYIQQSHIT